MTNVDDVFDSFWEGLQKKANEYGSDFDILKCKCCAKKIFLQVMLPHMSTRDRRVEK